MTSYTTADTKKRTFREAPKSALLLILFRIFAPALIDVILILAPWAAKGGVGTIGEEHFLAVFAQPQWSVIVHQQEAEHHLDTQEQRMEVPIDGRFVQQLDVIAGRDAAKGGHRLAVQPPALLVNGLIVVIV